MLIESYVAIALLVILLVGALVAWADKAYQQERWTQRWEQRQEQLVADEDAIHDWLLAEQIAEDTCAKHGVFVCGECFDLSPVW